MSLKLPRPLSTSGKKSPKKHLYEILTKVYITQLHKVENEADLLEIKKFIQKKIKKAKK